MQASTAKMAQAIAGLNVPTQSTRQALAGIAAPVPAATAAVVAGASKMEGAAEDAGAAWSDVTGEIEEVATESKGSFATMRDSSKAAFTSVRSDMKAAEGDLGALGAAVDSVDFGDTLAAKIGAAAGVAAATAQTVMASISDDLKSWSEHYIVMRAAKAVAASAGEALASLYLVYKASDFLVGLVTGASYKSENIDALIALNNQVKSLQGSLKVSAQEAHAYADAMARLGVDSGDVVSVHEGIEKAVRDNTDELDRLGVKYKDANGVLLTHEQILGNVKSKLDEYADGYDRTAAASAIGVGSYAKVNAALQVNAAELEKSKARLDEYQLAIGPETQAAVAAYEQAMRDFNNESQLTAQGFKRAIADSIMPILTDLAVSLKDGFPFAVRAFRGSVATVTSLFYGLQMSASMAVRAISGAVDGLTSVFAGMGRAAAAALRGDFSGAGDAIKAGIAGAGDAASDTFDKMVADAMIAQKRIGMAWGQDDRTQSLGEARGADTKVRSGKAWVAKPKEEKPAKPEHTGAEQSQMPEFEAELAKRKVAIERAGLEEDQIRHMSKEAELSYWQDVQKMAGLSLKDKAGAAKKAAEVELAGIKEGFDFKIATLNAEGAHYRSNMEERLRIEREIQSHYAEGTKERADSERKIVEIQRAAAEQEKQIVAQKEAAKRNAQLGTIALAEQAMQQAQQLGLVDNAKALGMQQQFEDQRYQIALAGLQQRLAAAESDPDRNPVEIGQVHAEIEALEQQHQMRMGQIKGALRSDQLSPVVSLAQGMQQSFATAIDGILSKTMSLRQAMVTIWKGISSGIIGEIAKILAKKAAAWAVEKAMAVAGIGVKAAEAGAGAAASQAAIPIVGPGMALAAMAAVMAGVIGLQGSIASASGGFDIPGNINPITQLHKKEMVLPERHAETIRRLGALGDQAMDGGGAAAPALPPVAVTYNDHSGRLTPEDIRRNSNVIGDIVNQQMRDNRIKPR